MKWLLVVLLVPAVAWSCKPGYVATDVEGVCQEGSFTHTDPAIMSDEKPPSDRMPSWQREGIKVVEAPNMEAEDHRQDVEKMDAAKEGKRRAGIK